MPVHRIVQLRRIAAVIAGESLFRRAACEVEGFAANRGSEGQADVFTDDCAGTTRDQARS